jgi:hypothetical protein
MIRFAAVALLLPGMALADGTRTVIPITQTALADHDIRYSIPVQVGDGPPVPALLDTGSTGLRVFRNALAAGSFTDTGTASVYAYGSGEELTGDIGTAGLAVGTQTTDAQIPFEIVQNAACMNFQPDCGAARVAPSSYGIGGDGIAGAGFQAIIGVSLTPDFSAGPTQNPLMRLGSHQWIIELPKPGQASPGSLILNPDGNDLAGFQMFPLRALSAPGGISGWADFLAGCLNDQTADQTICGPTVLDTGSPGILAYRLGASFGPLWAAGDSANLAFSTGGNGTAASIPFTADGFPGTGMAEEPPDGPFTLVAGVLPFFAYDVLYDASNGAIGLRPRADVPDAVAPPAQETSPDIEVIQMNAPRTVAPAKPAGGMQLPQVVYSGQ